MLDDRTQGERRDKRQRAYQDERRADDELDTGQIDLRTTTAAALRLLSPLTKHPRHG